MFDFDGISSFYFTGANWDDPNPNDIRYLQSLRNALLERIYFTRGGPHIVSNVTTSTNEQMNMTYYFLNNMPDQK